MLLSTALSVSSNHVCSYQWGANPLDCASKSGYLQVVRLLTARGAELESRDKVR